MTGFSEPHGAIPYATELLPPAELNTIVNNSRAQFRRSLSTWKVFPSPDPTGSNGRMIPLYVPSWDAILACVATAAGTASLYILLGNENDWLDLVSYSGMATGEQLILAQEPSTGGLAGFSDASSAGYYLSVGGAATGANTMGAYDFPGSSSFTASGPSLFIPGATAMDNTWIIPGRKDTDYPAVVAYSASASAAAIFSSATGSGMFMYRVASDGDQMVIAVGGVSTTKTVAISDDRGATWTWGAFPTLTGAPATAHPSITYDSVRELFVVTMLDATYRVNYCSSPDGSSWGDWHVIPGASAAPSEMNELTADIVAIGGTWIVCRPYVTELVAIELIQVLASHDGGATWFDISPPEAVSDYTGTWMVQLGNRVGIATCKCLAISEPFDEPTGIASELV